MDLKLITTARYGKLQSFKDLANNIIPGENIYEKTTPEGNTVLHMAAGSGNIDVVDEIVKEHSSLVLKSNRKGETPVHIAAKAGQGEVVSHFRESLKKFPKLYFARIKDNYGNTPLHVAVKNKHGEIVKELADADKESLLLINDAGESPLSIAIYMRFTGIAKMIIQLHKPTLEFIGNNGQTALHHAVIRHDYDTMDFILSENFSVKVRNETRIPLVKVRDAMRRTPLHYAAALSHHKMVEKLIQIDTSVAYIEDINQHIPVHLAAENHDQLSVIKLLLDCCPDTIEIVDNKQRNILHIAAENGSREVVSYILNSKEMEYMVNSPDVDGNTPLHLASKNYHVYVVDVLTQNQKVEIRATNNYNKTAFEVVKLPDDRGMELQKHLTLKVLRKAYKMRCLEPEGILEKKQWADVEKASNDGIKGQARKNGTEKVRQMAQMISVMSTLIATFTFTAAFTIPGGFKSGSIDNAGMATLIRNSAFRAFVIFDALAMTTSITSAAIVFWSVSIRDVELFMDILCLVIGLTWISLIAVTLAFVNGLFAVLQETIWLAISACVIGCAAPFVLYIAPILVSFVQNPKSRPNIVLDNPFFLIFQLMKMFVESHARDFFKSLRFY